MIQQRQIKHLAEKQNEKSYTDILPSTVTRVWSHNSYHSVGDVD